MPMSERRIPHPSRTHTHAPQSEGTSQHNKQQQTSQAPCEETNSTTTSTMLHVYATTSTHTNTQKCTGSVWATKHNNGGRGGKRTVQKQPLHARIWQCVHNLLHGVGFQVAIPCERRTRAECCHSMSHEHLTHTTRRRHQHNCACNKLFTNNTCLESDS